MTMPEPPAIGPAPARNPRPFWSVMVPTYNPDLRHLEACLTSVLLQAPSAAEMQICVYDDGSSVPIESRIGSIGQGRIEFERGERNAGLSFAWNACLRLAAGQWVHLLHQDDLVLDGFYQRLRSAIERSPEIGAAYVQHCLLDDRGNLGPVLSGNTATEAQIVSNWLEMVFERLTFQTPAIVVKREAYERLGGFRSDYRYALDWDMWKRIAAMYPIWYDPAPLAAYRRHDGATSMEFLRSGRNLEEMRRSIEQSAFYLPENLRQKVMRPAYANLRVVAVDTALNGLFVLGDWRIAKAQMAYAVRTGSASSLPLLVARRVVASGRRWLARDR